jgi:hypothetical protein
MTTAVDRCFAGEYVPDAPLGGNPQFVEAKAHSVIEVNTGNTPYYVGGTNPMSSGEKEGTRKWKWQRAVPNELPINYTIDHWYKWQRPQIVLQVNGGHARAKVEFFSCLAPANNTAAVDSVETPNFYGGTYTHPATIGAGNNIIHDINGEENVTATSRVRVDTNASAGAHGFAGASASARTGTATSVDTIVTDHIACNGNKQF